MEKKNKNSEINKDGKKIAEMMFSNPEKEVGYIPLSEAAKITGYTPEYLNSLARKGALRAEKIGRNWHTKKVWVEEMIRARKGEEMAEEKIEMEWKEKDFFVSAIEAARLYKTKTQDKKKSDQEVEKKENIRFEEYFISSEKKWKKTLSRMTTVAAVLPIVIIATFFIRISSQRYSAQLDLIRGVFERNNVESGIINENDDAGIVKGEETGNQNVEADESRIVLASENFTARQVSLGGDVIMLANENVAPFQISDIKSESFISGKKDEVKLVLSWKTDQMSTSEVTLSKNGGQNGKTVKENSYGFNHSAIISELEQRTSYVYSIKAKDRFGNVVESNYFGIFTTSKPVSVFDLISKAMGDVFGWAVKK